ncbi:MULTISPECIES: hypothetical protein [Acinetobacter]|nr:MULTISPECIES: hypothetical protein [Acinetobacter]
MNERNDATDYYVQLIKKSLEASGQAVLIIDDLKNIEKNDKVLTISLKAFFYTWLRNPKQFIFHWFQGVTPEEARMLFSNKRFQRNIRWMYLSLFERFVLLFSKFNFFVSGAMLDHYKYKYKYKKNNFMVMPCYNQKLNMNAFYDEKYKEPTFVYAGSLSDWQCINETLQVFKEIQYKIPAAKMFLYTAEKEKAFFLIEKNQIKNIVVDYVEYSQLNDVLKNIKYGFLIRKDMVVNNVSTPTKMNGYLANGVIPIYSDFIFDFKLNLKGDFLISSKSHLDMIDKVIKFEENKICSDEVKSEYSLLFEKYYSDEKYIKEILKKFKKFEVI